MSLIADIPVHEQLPRLQPYNLVRRYSRISTANPQILRMLGTLHLIEKLRIHPQVLFRPCYIILHKYIYALHLNIYLFLRALRRILQNCT